MKHIEHSALLQTRQMPRWRCYVTDTILVITTAIMTSQLASWLRQRAKQAHSRERELRILYEQAQEIAALQERQRLSRELHDSVLQALYGINLVACNAREALESRDSEQVMVSLQERATKIGATLTVESAAGQGTCIRVWIPLEAGGGSLQYS